MTIEERHIPVVIRGTDSEYGEPEMPRVLRALIPLPMTEDGKHLVWYIGRLEERFAEARDTIATLRAVAAAAQAIREVADDERFSDEFVGITVRNRLRNDWRAALDAAKGVLE